MNKNINPKIKSNLIFISINISTFILFSFKSLNTGCIQCSNALVKVLSSLLNAVCANTSQHPKLKPLKSYKNQPIIVIIVAPLPALHSALVIVVVAHSISLPGADNNAAANSPPNKPVWTARNGANKKNNYCYCRHYCLS